MSEHCRKPRPQEQAVLDGLQVRLLESAQLKQCNERLEEHHYLGSVKPVGERLYYVVTGPQGEWLAPLVFAAAAQHLKYRDRWIGWTDVQRERRLALVVDNVRFLLRPHKTFPHLGTRVLRMVLARLSQDWQRAHGHRVLGVETFVDPEQFCGTVDAANGWQALGQTDGSGRHQRDYHVRHDKPKRLLVRELVRHARRSLQAEKLKPALAVVEAQVGRRSRHTTKEIKSIVDYLKQVPEHRARVGTYPLWSLLAIYLLAVLCGAPRGSKDLAQCARKLRQAQRRALGIRLRHGRYPAPSQPTFWRLWEEIDGTQLEEVLLPVQAQWRGSSAPKRVDRPGGQRTQTRRRSKRVERRLRAQPVLLGQRDGRHQDPRDPRGAKALCGPGLEGPICLAGCPPHPDPDGSRYRAGGGGDYLLTVKENQLKLHQNIQKPLPAPKADSPPLGSRRPRSIAPSSTKRAVTSAARSGPSRSAPSRFVFPWPPRRPACCAKPAVARMKTSALLPAPRPKSLMPRNGWS